MVSFGKTLVFIVSFIAFVGCVEKIEFQSDLSGEWNYRLDTLEVGEQEKWFSNTLEQTILLPGALRDYGIGHEPDLNTNWTGSIYDSSWYFNPALEKYRQNGDMKYPFWLTPEKHYVGMVWYQREIEIPETWLGKDLVLHLERPHWQTTVWLDTVQIGSDNSLSVPHEFIISKSLVTKGTHRLTVRVDNAIRDIDPGINSHSLSDHTQGNWNGMVGNMQLFAKDTVRINTVRIQPNLSKNSVEVKVKLSSALPNVSIKFNISGLNHVHSGVEVIEEWTSDTDSMTFQISMGTDYKTWSEFSPNLYEMTLELNNTSNISDVKTEVFGMRKFSINDKHFEINDTTIFLRGTTECSVFPLTGYPPTNEQEWAHIYEVCKSFGLNHVRFHSYCPPEAAFIAADKAGIYLQVEGPSWAKYSTSLGYGKPIDKYLMDETKRIIDAYGNHPSFCMMAYGNEPSGRYVGYLENWVDHFRAYDPQRVFTGASTGRSWSIIENSDFIVRSPPRGLKWKNQQPESEFDYRNNTENQDRPYVTFEMGQWCVYPNFKEIDKYTGALKAKNFELFREDLADNHMSDLADEFLMASGKLQASCYKQEIEATLRTPNLAGFQLLSLNDFSGQGTALVGVLDAFWDEKGYISANEFKSFCNAVVPLARFPKFTFESEDTLSASIEIANFSGREITGVPVVWKLIKDSVNVVKEGSFNAKNIAVGHGNQMGEINIPLNFVETATEYSLSVSIGEYQNQWKVWCYPTKNKEIAPGNVLVVDAFNESAKQALKQGKNVLLLAAGKVENGKEVIHFQTPAFWNTSWFRMRPPHTTGVLVQDQHPVFNNFPTNSYSDHQWWEVGNRQQIMNLEFFPPVFRPLVQPVDTWFLNRRLAMLFEAKVGKGKLMVCSIDLENEMQNRPVARQLKKSILTYMNSEKFAPKSNIDLHIVDELFEKKERPTWNSYVGSTP